MSGLRSRAQVQAWFACWEGCAYCTSRKALTVDHVVPTSLGGAKRSLTNLLPCCFRCNRAKGGMSAERWFASLDESFTERLVEALRRFEGTPSSSAALGPLEPLSPRPDPLDAVFERMLREGGVLFWP